MSIKTLVIKWYYGKEYIDLGKIVLNHFIETHEYWPSLGTFVTYRAHVQRSEMDGNSKIITLRYKMDEQEDRNVTNPDNGVRMGLSVTRINENNEKASATWSDEDVDHTTYNGRVEAVIVGEQNPYTNLRQTALVVVKLRPMQQEMRDLLLYFDKGKCLITGESEVVALDAAHVVPVSAGGNEVPENAILLRTDLHRLFDAGLFWFVVEEKQAIIQVSNTLPAKYGKILSGKILNGDTFSRVKVALEARSGLGLKR